MSQGPGDHCALCGRSGVVLTRHHLIPRTRHSNKRTRQRFNREERLGSLLMVCRPCHKQIHAVLNEKQLEREFHSREKLLAHPDIQRFVRWIAERPAGFVPRSYPKKS